MKTCDNGRAAYRGHPICAPACYIGVAARTVTVSYNEVEKDTLELCEDCAKVISRDAKRHGYRVSSRRSSREV
jgi:hypothetical protein